MELLLLSIVTSCIYRILLHIFNHTVPFFHQGRIQTVEVSEGKIFSLQRSVHKRETEFIGPWSSKNVDFFEMNISPQSWDFNRFAIGVLKIRSEVISFNDINCNISSFLNFNTSFSIAEIIVSVDFTFNCGKQFLQCSNHPVQIIQFFLSDFLLLEIYPVYVSINFCIYFILLSFSNRNLCSQPFHFYFQFGCLRSKTVCFIPELPDFLLKNLYFSTCFSHCLIICSYFILTSLYACLESFLSVLGNSELVLEISQEGLGLGKFKFLLCNSIPFFVIAFLEEANLFLVAGDQSFLGCNFALNMVKLFVYFLKLFDCFGQSISKFVKPKFFPFILQSFYLIFKSFYFSQSSFNYHFYLMRCKLFFSDRRPYSTQHFKQISNPLVTRDRIVRCHCLHCLQNRHRVRAFDQLIKFKG